MKNAKPDNIALYITIALLVVTLCIATIIVTWNSLHLGAAEHDLPEFKMIVTLFSNVITCVVTYAVARRKDDDDKNNTTTSDSLSEGEGTEGK